MLAGVTLEAVEDLLSATNKLLVHSPHCLSSALRGTHQYGDSPLGNLHIGTGKPLMRSRYFSGWKKTWVCVEKGAGYKWVEWAVSCLVLECRAAVPSEGTCLLNYREILGFCRE